jgi:hypothetical protein
MSDSFDLRDPIVIDPPGFDAAKAWQGCRDEVDACGGLSYEDGSPNWRAAFSADPGCCHCPACRAYYWAWGRIQKCIDCGFVYPTDAWEKFSYGNGAGRRNDTAYKHEERMRHPYYRYGFLNPAADAWEAFRAIDWRKAVGDWEPKGEA